MALNGKGGKPSNNTTAAPSPKVRLSSTGGSIAKNNTNFSKGPMGTIGGLKQKSKGEVVTNPEFDKLANTGRPAGGKTMPIKKNRYGQPNEQVRHARGASDSTVANLKSYLARKAQGKVR